MHFIYLYTLWKKTKVLETADVFLRNIEYMLYFIYMVYLFKFGESIFRIMAYNDFKDEIIPENFIPIGILLMALHFLILVVTPLTFLYRKNTIGEYNFDELHDDIQSWK